MQKIIFIEGISCAGKTTMVKKISSLLAVNCGYYVRSYLEFDSTNPIDFYCAAYFPCTEYDNLCKRYPEYREKIHSHTVFAGNARLVRYYDNDTPLFPEPLLSELMKHEFCWNPEKPIPLQKYTECYEEVWRNWIGTINGEYDHYIFDGSLMHHPINDMMRNYAVSAEQACSHIKTLLGALGEAERKIVYLSIDNIERQLINAHCDRGEDLPDSSDIVFWKKRYDNDMYVLEHLNENKRIFDAECRWDTVKNEILKYILS